jgi:hypothetical protein
VISKPGIQHAMLPAACSMYVVVRWINGMLAVQSRHSFRTGVLSEQPQQRKHMQCQTNVCWFKSRDKLQTGLAAVMYRDC